MKSVVFFISLVACLVAASSSATIRGSGVHREVSRKRGHHLQEVSCILRLWHTMFESNDENPDWFEEEKWVCELSSMQSFVIDGESPGLKALLDTAISGKSRLVTSAAIVDTEKSTIYLPFVSSTMVTNSEPMAKSVAFAATSASGRGPEPTGNIRALVVRLTDSMGHTPDASAADLANGIFSDDISFKKQMNACSYGKLDIEPFIGETPNGVTVSNGVIDIKLDYDITTTEQGDPHKAQQQTAKIIGDLNDERYDLIMFCFPSGSKMNWHANAEQGGKKSNYNNKFCTASVPLMHEIGHNLGLGHSGTTDLEYGDVTGSMGSSGAVNARKCYNPRHSYQLGWYKDQTKTINPLDGNFNREFILNGVSDYEKNPNALVVLRLDQENKQENEVHKCIYIGFNRAEGINSDTPQDKNKVIVLGQGENTSSSIKLASLSPGDQYTLKNFNNERDIKIEFFGLKNGNAKIRVIDTNQPDPPSLLPSVPCETFTVEIKTDSYPQDNYWFIKDSTGNVKASDGSFKNKNFVYKKNVCLDYDSKYKFVFNDEYGDGIWGYYKVMNSEGTVVVDGSKSSGKFTVKKGTITVGSSNLSPAPTSSPPKFLCKDKRGRFKLKASNKKARTCKYFSKKNKCNAIQESEGVPIWKLCPVSCKKCVKI